MTHDEVRSQLRGFVLESAPTLASAVLTRQDFDLVEQLAVRVDAAVDLLARYEREVEESPDEDGLILMKRLEHKLKLEKPSEGPKGPSIWELLQKPAL